MESVKWIYQRVRPYFLFILLALLGSLLESAGATGITLIIKAFVDNVFLIRSYEELIKSVGLLLLFALVGQLGSFLASIFINLYSELELKKIRREIFEKLLRAPYHYLIKSSSGDIITRILSDLQAYRNLLGEYVPRLIRDPITVIALIGVLLYRDALLTLLLGVLLPILALAVRYFGSKKGKHLKRLQENVSHLTQNLNQVLRGYENIKMFSAESRFIRWFSSFNEKVFKASMKSVIYSTGNSVFNFIFGYLVVAGIMLYGGLRVLQGALTPGDFVSYLTALFLIQLPLSEAQKGFMEVRANLPIVKRIRELLDMPKEEEGGITFEGLKEGITLKDVKVCAGEREILKGVSLTIKKGSKVGVIGHTGSGKSTFLRALAGLLSYEGSIKYDSLELSSIEKRSLRDKIGFLTQEPFIFSGSVRDNLLIAKESATEEEMKRALELAFCDFVESLDDVMEEGGKNLSGGEMQRLALARLFLKDPEIVLLDEATSAMDVKTEERVLKNIFEFFKDRTVIVVAHRFSNVLMCDKVYAFKDGKVIAEGEPKEVINAFLQSP